MKNTELLKIQSEVLRDMHQLEFFQGHTEHVKVLKFIKSMNSCSTFCLKNIERKFICLFKKLEFQITVLTMNNMSYVESEIKARDTQRGIVVIQVKGYERKKRRFMQETYLRLKEQDVITDWMQKREREKRRQREDSKLIQLSGYDSQTMELPEDKETHSRLFLWVTVEAMCSVCVPPYTSWKRQRI